MEYKGKLYGRFNGKKYFDTGKTADDWDDMEEANKSASRVIDRLKASIQGALDGAELDNSDDVIEKSVVISQFKDLLKIISNP